MSVGDMSAKSCAPWRSSLTWRTSSLDNSANGSRDLADMSFLADLAELSVTLRWVDLRAPLLYLLEHKINAKGDTMSRASDDRREQLDEQKRNDLLIRLGAHREAAASALEELTAVPVGLTELSALRDELAAERQRLRKEARLAARALRDELAALKLELADMTQQRNELEGGCSWMRGELKRLQLRDSDRLLGVAR